MASAWQGATISSWPSHAASMSRVYPSSLISRFAHLSISRAASYTCVCVCVPHRPPKDSAGMLTCAPSVQQQPVSVCVLNMHTALMEDCISSAPASNRKRHVQVRQDKRNNDKQCSGCFFLTIKFPVLTFPLCQQK